jgi:lipopolysaccharide transport system permease protein
MPGQARVGAGSSHDAPITGYQAILLQGRWPDPVTWLVMGIWLIVLGLMLDVVVRRSRDQLVDWL